MNDTNSNNTEENENDDQSQPGQDPLHAAAEAIAEMLTDSEFQIKDEEAIVIANELLEKFTSPLMIALGAGASSQVSVTMSPTGDVESARSIKTRNVLINLKDAAYASISSLPALAVLFEKYGKPGSGAQIAVAAVIALFGLLKTLASASGIPLTRRTAGVLNTLWSSKAEDAESVAHQGLLEKVNVQFEQYKWDSINSEELITHLETLERLNSIEKVETYNSISMENIQWRLKESVKLSF
jgi:hypothetical protein